MPIQVTSEKIILSKGSSTSTIYLFGATITSWTQNKIERLFLSSKANFQGPKAIRGGIPIVFPQFGPGTLPQHGFARLSHWTYSGIMSETDDFLELSIGLAPDKIPVEQRKLWDYDFYLEYIVEIGDKSLKSSLIVHNRDSREFKFSSLLHTYLAVPDVRKTTVLGLKGCNLTNSLTKTQEIEGRRLVEIDQEVDSVYSNVSQNLHVDSIKIEKSNFCDVVIWNPWIEKARGMSDFDDKEYLSMICVEVGNVVESIILKAKQSYTSSQTLTLTN